MLTRNRKPVIALALLAVSLIIALLLFNVLNDKDRLQYSPKGTNNMAGPMVIKAHEDIDSKSGTYSISPSVSGNLQVVDNYIIFWPEQDGGFVIDTRYRAIFKDYKTVSNEPIQPVNLEFTISRDADYDELQREVLSKYGHFEASFNPFLEKLPYKEDYRFRINYAINESLGHHHEDDDDEDAGIIALLGDEDNWREKKDNYIVYIETLIFQSQGQSYESYVHEVKEARKDALEWIAEQGVNVKKDINYQFIPNDKTLQNPGSGREEVPTILGDDY